jgi:hypothetical protein
LAADEHYPALYHGDAFVFADQSAGEVVQAAVLMPQGRIMQDDLSGNSCLHTTSRTAAYTSPQDVVCKYHFPTIL